MAIIASELWEKAHQQNIHQHINRIPWIRNIFDKWFNGFRVFGNYVDNASVGGAETLPRDAELSKYEDGFELLFD